LLLGPSGSGKSTLALALGGLIPGVIEAQVTGELRPARRAGVLFQDPEAQFCMFTVDEEVAFGLENRCVPPAQMPARVAKALAAAGLDVPFGHPIQALSGGQKQRLALAAVLVLEPALLILDEPTAQLDPAGRALVLETLRRLPRRHTVLVIEHNLDGVVEWVDRVVLLAPGGRLLADGEPEAVFRRHRSAIEAYGIWRPRSWGPFWRPVVAGAGCDGGAPSARGDGSRVPPSSADRRPTKGTAVSAPIPGTGLRRAEERVGALAEEGAGQVAEGSAGAAEGSAATGPKRGTPLVRLEAVAAGHGRRMVWQDVSLTITAGEWVVVLGPNGAGKSTFLQVAAGLHPPAKGRVVHAPGLEGGRGGAAAVGFVFQNPEHQFVTESVYEEVALAGRLAGLPEAELRSRVEALLARFGLADLARAHPYTLSQGQKRRLSVASMLVVPRPILFLDEPTFGQDARTAAALVEELVGLHRQGTTLVMATHDLELAEAVATRLLVFGNGRLVYDGPPQALLDDPPRLAAVGLEAAALHGAAVPGSVAAAPADGGIPLEGAHPLPGPGGRTGATGEAGPDGGEKRSPAAASRGPAGASALGTPAPARIQPEPRTPWIGRVHPVWKLAAHLVLAGLVLATDDPATLAALLAVPVGLGLAFGGIGVRSWLVGMAPFVVVAATRVWTLGAFGEGHRLVAQVLWYRFTAEGLHHGLVVGLRLLGVGALGVLYVRTTGLADLVLGLVQQGGLSPRWAYGLLAALRFVPLFQDELARVRKAYRVRGLTGRGLRGRLEAAYRYSLALLVHAVRAAEAVAVALQARGFDGSRKRTFYRTLTAGWREAGYAGLLLGLAAVALVASARLR
ncbi:MAG TPA: ATP-binding cassette domain-containing protein, partial [Thermaerobacter sp.]